MLLQHQCLSEGNYQYAFSEQFDYVVIDGEAGIEQINRRVMEKVTSASGNGSQQKGNTGHSDNKKSPMSLLCTRRLAQ